MTAEFSTRLQNAANALIARGAREVYVLGSAIRETLRPDSDIDLAVSGLRLVDLDDDHPIVHYLKTHGELVRLA